MRYGPFLKSFKLENFKAVQKSGVVSFYPAHGPDRQQRLRQKQPDRRAGDLPFRHYGWTG